MIYRYHPLTITLRSPAILSQLGGDPNAASTMAYIPGGTLQGMLARALGDPGADEGRLEAFREIALGGRARFLNGYPADGGRRALPIPLTFRVEKGAASLGAYAVIDLAAGADPHTDGPGESLQSPPFAFVSLGAAQPRAVHVAMGSRVHQQRDPRRGRAWTERQNGREIAHGAVFAYEYLEAGQTFIAMIQVMGASEPECDAVAQRAQKLLNGSAALLGRSRRAGYGGDASMEWGPPRAREIIGEGLINADIPAGTTFRALLVSPCIVRDARTGQLDPGALESILVDRMSQKAEVTSINWGFTQIGAFNRKWRLELPQAVAAAAGSVVVLRAIRDIALADLLDIEHEGIGERLAQGFGRCCFLEAPSPRVRILPPPVAVAMQPAGEPHELVRFVEGRVIEAAVNRAVDQRASEIAHSARDIPTPSLLGRLRVPLRGDRVVARETLRTWCGDGDGALRRPARDQLDRCRLRSNGRSQSLLEFIRTLLAPETQRDQAWERVLGLDGLAERNHVISSRSAADVLRTRHDDVTVRLLDAVLAAMSRLERREP